MERNLVYLVVALSLIAFVPAAGAQSISEEQLAAYSIPSVFQALTAVDAELEFPAFQVDRQTLRPFVYYEGANGIVVDYIRKGIESNQSITFIRSELKLVGWVDEDIEAALRVAVQSPPPGKKLERVAIKRTLALGTAFAVREDGYLLTNAHVVEEGTPESVRAILVANAIEQYLWQTVSAYGLTVDEQYLFESELYNYLQQNGRLVKFKKEYYVVPPSLTTLPTVDEELFAASWPAELTKAGKAYPGKDVAILKIEKGPLPALPISKESPRVGEKIFALGYPAAANINQLSTNEPSLTSGVVSAIRRSDNNDFEIIQTDISIGGGSSGGPVLNRRGEVVGIVTLGNLNFAQYGNFNFFLPISLAEELIASAKSPAPAVGEATASYREVADLLLEGKCESGRAKVAELQKLLASKFIDRVLGDCYRKEGGGESVRGFFGVALPSSPSVWFLGGLAAGGVIAVGVWAVLRSRRRPHEQA